MPDAEWSEEFFNGPWADVQRAFWSAEKTREQVDFIERELGLRAGADVLDVPCGEGRISLELSARGHRVVGLDRAAGLAGDARRLAAERGLAAEFHVGDMRALPWTARFDAAISFWTCVGYGEDTDDERYFAAVWAALRPAGVFLVDAFPLEAFLSRFQARSWNRIGDTILLEERGFDAERCRATCAWTFARDCRVQTVNTSLRVYSCRELSDLLRRAGFSHVRAIETLTGRPFDRTSERLTLVASKGGG